MVIKRCDLSIVIPAYNEEKKIKKDIEAAFQFLKQAKLSGEVIVSTDGVTDKTNDIVTTLKQKHRNLILIAKKNKIGKGFAIKEGVLKAQGDVIMFADAGLCVPYKYAKEGLLLLRQGNDYAIASRVARGSIITSPQPGYRRIGSKIFGMIVRTLLGIPRKITDTQCGFKLYQKKAAKRLFRDLSTRGFMFDIELILRAQKLGFNVAQFPVKWSNDSDTKFHPIKGTIRNIKELYRIKMVEHL